MYGAFYTPKIITPSVHFLGSLDTVVDEGRSRSLLEACELPVEYVHPGGHFLPSQKVWVEALLGFIGGCCGEEKKNKKGGGEEKGVEDMDVPF